MFEQELEQLIMRPSPNGCPFNSRDRMSSWLSLSLSLRRLASAIGNHRGNYLPMCRCSTVEGKGRYSTSCFWHVEGVVCKLRLVYSSNIVLTVEKISYRRYTQLCVTRIYWEMVFQPCGALFERKNLDFPCNHRFPLRNQIFVPTNYH